MGASQNVPELVKTSPNWSKRPQTRKKIGQNVPIFKRRFSEEIWDSFKKNLVYESLK